MEALNCPTGYQPITPYWSENWKNEVVALEVAYFCFPPQATVVTATADKKPPPCLGNQSMSEEQCWKLC